MQKIETHRHQITFCPRKGTGWICQNNLHKHRRSIGGYFYKIFGENYVRNTQGKNVCFTVKKKKFFFFWFIISFELCECTQLSIIRDNGGDGNHD
jgi:hypothetical protein